MTEDEILSGVQATQDIASAMLTAADDCLRVHGNDPTAPAILAAAVVLFISQIEKNIYPTFRQRVVAQLAGGAT